ncbi:UNVERIFIED_CONTAM: hypothetical protein K2H54_056033 [Gekko kuhli]
MKILKKIISVFLTDPQHLFLFESVVVAKEDGDTLIPCAVTDPDVSNFTLKGCDGKPLPDNMVIIPDPQKGFTVKSVQRSFHGCYQCVVLQNGVERMSESIFLIVRAVHRSVPAITLSKADQLLKEGEEFKVTCTIKDVDSTLQANWIFQGKANVSIKSKNMGDFEYERKLTLNIRSVGVNDSGVFVCQGSNHFGTSNATITLKVLGNGYVSLSATTNTTVNVNDGENLELAVAYEAYPKPEEEVWMYMNQTLQNSSDHYVRITSVDKNRYSTELHLTRLKGAEGGVYTFLVSNSDATSSIAFNVYVNILDNNVEEETEAPHPLHHSP